MLGTLKLANKLRNRQRGGKKNSHSDPVTMVQCLDMPRPPGRRRLEQPRPPERDSESGDPARPRIRDWFRGRDTHKRNTDTMRYRRDGWQRGNEEMFYSKGRNQAGRFIEDEDYMHVNEENHLGKRQRRRRDKASHRNEDFQDRRYDTDMYHRHDKERRQDKVRCKVEDFPLSDNEDIHVRHVEDSHRAREVLNKKKHRFKERRPKDDPDEIRRHPGEKRPRQIELKSQKRKDTRPKQLAKSDVIKRFTKDDSKPIRSKKQLANAKSKRKSSLTIKKSGMPNANKPKRSRLCENQKEMSLQKAFSIKRKCWVEDLRVYKEPTNKRLTVFKGILGKDRQCKVAKSNEVTKPQNCRAGFHRDFRKPGEWQAKSTRFEVNARLGNIERSLKDLALSTKKVVYTRLRVIENSLKDMNGFRERLGIRRNKPAKTKTLDRSKNRVAPKQKEKQTIQWVYESKAYQKDLRKTKKEKPKSLEREKKVERKKKKTYNRELKFRNEDETPLELEKKRVKKHRISEETKRGPERRPESPPQILDEGIETDTAHPEKITCDVHVPSGQGDRRDLKDMHFSIFDDTVIDVDGAPKQTSIVDTTIEGDLCPPDLRGIVVLDIDDIIAIIVTDWANRSIKCFYSIENQNCYSQLKLAAGPWGIKKLRNNLIGVTIPKAQQIMLLRVTPDLIHESTIETSKCYWGLAVMTSSTLIGGSSQPSCLDEIDVEGNILQSFSNITSPDGTIENPDCIHVTKTGDILLSDSGRKSVMCVTSSGDVKFTFSPCMGQELLYPSGVVSISSGDILLADSAANKVIHLNETGKYERDVLASRSDVEKPFGLCVNGNNIYVATRCREVQVYSFS